MLYRTIDGNWYGPDDRWINPWETFLLLVAVRYTNAARELLIMRAWVEALMAIRKRGCAQGNPNVAPTRCSPCSRGRFLSHSKSIGHPRTAIRSSSAKSPLISPKLQTPELQRVIPLKDSIGGQTRTRIRHWTTVKRFSKTAPRYILKLCVTA